MHTGRVEYVEPLCGHAEIFLLLRNLKVKRGNICIDIEVKAVSGKCLAKCAAVARGDDTCF